MRARMALFSSSQTCEIREVLLNNKPIELINISPKGTVPVLEFSSGLVIEQSLEIMCWALEQNDPLGWLTPEFGKLEDMLDLIKNVDGDFKYNLDHYKYAQRYENSDPMLYRTEGERFLRLLNERLGKYNYLFGTKPSLADYAIMPFVRQFANTDRTWFNILPVSALQKWLNDLLASDIFGAIMNKYPAWQGGDSPIIFFNNIQK